MRKYIRSCEILQKIFFISNELFSCNVRFITFTAQAESVRRALNDCDLKSSVKSHRIVGPLKNCRWQQFSVANQGNWTLQEELEIPKMGIVPDLGLARFRASPLVVVSRVLRSKQ
jgi:hypothetical protein